MKVRTSNSATMTGAPDWSTCNAITSGTNITGNNCVTSPAQYVQYQAALTSTGTSPTLNDVTIYYGYAPSATLTSSAFNTQNTGNVLNKMTWTENLPVNTDIKFQVRAAPARLVNSVAFRFSENSGKIMENAVMVDLKRGRRGKHRRKKDYNNASLEMAFGII